VSPRAPNVQCCSVKQNSLFCPQAKWLVNVKMSASTQENTTVLVAGGGRSKSLSIFLPAFGWWLVLIWCPAFVHVDIATHFPFLSLVVVVLTCFARCDSCPSWDTTCSRTRAAMQKMENRQQAHPFPTTPGTGWPAGPSAASRALHPSTSCKGLPRMLFLLMGAG